jgi:hypothetical protein
MFNEARAELKTGAGFSFLFFLILRMLKVKLGNGTNKEHSENV